MTAIQSPVTPSAVDHPLADGLLTVQQAATLLAVGKSTLYEAMERGELPYCKIGRARRIPRRAVLDWAAAQMTGGWAMQPHCGFGRSDKTLENTGNSEPCCLNVATGTEG